MNNTEFYNLFSFNIYFRSANYVTDNSKNLGAPFNFVALMLKGMVKLKTRNQVIEIKEGEVFFIPKNQLYDSHWFVDKNGEIEFLSLGASNLPISSTTHYLIQKINCTDNQKEILYKFLDDRTVSCKTVGLFYEFLGNVFPFMERNISHNELTLEKALDYMYQNNSFKTKNIADYLNVSEATIYNIFSKNLGKTPLEMKQMISCEKAVNLLTTTNLSVEQISGYLGFSSSSYFRKILKKHTNKTPLQVRKEALM